MSPLIFTLLFCVSPVPRQSEVDPALPSYKPEVTVSGTLRMEGSEALINCMSLCAEEFRKLHPGALLRINGRGTGSGPPAMIEDSAVICMAAREMRPNEIDLIEKKHGRKPVVVNVLYSSIAVVVHKENPLESLTLAQLDAIFSSTRRHGFKEEIRTWGQLGLAGEWKDRPIGIAGRNSASSMYGMFKSIVLQGGDFKDSIKEQPGSTFVGSVVESRKDAIDYMGGFWASRGNLKVIGLAAKEGGKPVLPLPEAAVNGTYPISGPLSLAFLQDSNGTLDALRREFLLFVLSKQGQELVLRDGHIPLTAALAKEQRDKLGSHR